MRHEFMPNQPVALAGIAQHAIYYVVNQRK
jgi:hypothetical protein